MRILVDGDAAPVKEITIEVAKRNKLEVFIFIDTSHVYESDYAKVIMVCKGRDAVDYTLMENIVPQDIVITNDYPLAAIALLKGAFCIGFSGLIYTKENIDILLAQRQLNQKMRNSGKRGTNIKKRKEKDNEKFRKSLEDIIKKTIN